MSERDKEKDAASSGGSRCEDVIKKQIASAWMAEITTKTKSVICPLTVDLAKPARPETLPFYCMHSISGAGGAELRHLATFLTLEQPLLAIQMPGGVINIGGQKVHPEEIEAVINRHPDVWMSRVRARKNPITGAIVVADVVAVAEHAPLEALKGETLEACRGTLARHMVPASIHFVTTIEVAASGKLARVNV